MVEDAMQEAWIRIQRSFHQFEGRGSLDSWFNSIAIRELERIRRKRRREITDERVEDLASKQHSPESQPDEANVQEFADGVVAIISAAVQHEYVTAPEAEIMRARIEFSDFSLGELCVHLGISEQNGAIRHMRGVQNLRVFYFCERFQSLGGRQIILEAFARARQTAVNPLTAEEATAFEKHVLNRPPKSKKPPLSRVLRTACTKVTSQLSKDL